MNVAAPRAVMTGAAPLDRLAPLVGDERVARTRAAVASARAALGRRSLWNVNSTAAGGGVAEMLHALLPYCRGLDAGVRWLVLSGDAAFFVITKRVCNRLYGVAGDGGGLGGREHDHFRAVSAANAPGVCDAVRRGDVVVLHDPQTAGLAHALRRAGATVLWRCHVGRDDPNGHTDEAWEFLRPYLEDVDAFVFSTRRHVPAWLPRGARVEIVPPSIDPFSPKNAEVPAHRARALLAAAGVVAGPPRGHAARAVVLRAGDAPPEGEPLVVQVSRWDRLKDMTGVLRACASRLDGARLVLAGPDVTGVADDPEGRAMLDDCERAWRRLPPRERARVDLVCLPMDDPVANARVVNALQRHAAVVVQKSLAEGFGLTVTEAMWKARPVVAGAVGGIRDQIDDGRHGVLVEPRDLDACGRAVRALLDDRARAGMLGAAARERVAERYLADRHIARWAGVVARVAG